MSLKDRTTGVAEPVLVVLQTRPNAEIVAEGVLTEAARIAAACSFLRLIVRHTAVPGGPGPGGIRNNKENNQKKIASHLACPEFEAADRAAARLTADEIGLY